MNEKGQFVAQVCHIRAASPGGSRYGPSMTDEERRSVDNLLILCYRHHVETNDAGEYPADVLVQMKEEHERSVTGHFEPAVEVIKQLTVESERYWMAVELANTVQNSLPDDIRIDLPTRSGVADLLSMVRAQVDGLENVQSSLVHSSEALHQDVVERLENLGYDADRWATQPYYLDPTINRDWELLNIGFPNLLIDLRMLIDLIEIKHLELRALHSAGDSDLTRLGELRTKVLEYAKSIGRVD